MHLRQHLDETGRTQAAFGKCLIPAASQGLVGQWLRGVTRITLHYALEIERESGGAVTPKDSSDMFIDPANRPTPSVDTNSHPSR